jgi:hypothetical protein
MTGVATPDESALTDIRNTLAADDYHLTVTPVATGVEIRIAAGPSACDDCLVPKPLMRAMLHDALGVPESSITLVYPSEAVNPG